MDYNKKERLFLIIIIATLLVTTMTIFSSNNITGQAYNSYVNLTLLSNSAPYLDNITPIAVNVGDHINFNAIGHDADNNTLYFNDTCSMFNINYTTGLIDFYATYSMVGNYKCNITVTDSSFSNYTEFSINISSICGDGYCAPNELCSSCSIDCGACPASASTSSTSSGGLSQGIPASQLCSPTYDCSSWSRCMKDGYSYRSCTLTNSCSGHAPIEQKSCIYTPTNLERSITTSNNIAYQNPAKAISETNSVISLKEEDIKLLEELRFDDWKSVDSQEETFTQAKGLLDDIKKTLNMAKTTTENGQKVYNIFNANAKVEQIVRDIPEVKKVANNCFDRVDYVANEVNKDSKEKVYNSNKNLKINKCFTNYNVTNKETSDKTIKLTKVDLTVTINEKSDQKLIVEVVPKTVAKSINDIKFYNTENLIIIQDDPIFAWKINNLKGGEVVKLSYIVKTHANDSQTGSIKGIGEEKRISVVGQALNKPKTTCSYVILYKTYAILLLAISLFILLITNIILPLNKYVSKKEIKTYNKTMLLSNRSSYYAVFIFATYSIIIDLICFQKEFLIEILGFFLIMITVYFMNQPINKKYLKYKEQKK